ncbi:MAG: hypothetical protein HQL94_04545 [Magnetococcales bacterium]|nr:hypothetical protein [Magnetococcales bacterium]MBF0439456.1 hypothetical protein [Magnetococcales bacterium]
MINNLNKRKQGARWSAIVRIPERTSGGRPSVLAQQKVERRVRKKTQESVCEERTPCVREVPRRRAVALSVHPLGMRLLEGGVVLAAGISLIVKNGISHLAGWIRDGRERVSGSDEEKYASWEEDVGEESEEGIWEGGDVERTGNGVTKSLRVAENLSMLPPLPLREEVEFNKVQLLDAEEDGLPEEELDDQAGALRARLSDPSRHV